MKVWKCFIDFVNFHKTIFTYSTGLISNGFWPSWTFNLWWIPVLTAIFGTLANLLIVKLVLKQQYSSTAIICAKISLEALVLFVSTESVDLSPTNLVALVFLLSSLIVVMFYNKWSFLVSSKPHFNMQLNTVFPSIWIQCSKSKWSFQKWLFFFWPFVKSVNSCSCKNYLAPVNLIFIKGLIRFGTLYIPIWWMCWQSSITLLKLPPAKCPWPRTQFRNRAMAPQTYFRDLAELECLQTRHLLVYLD